jgi:transcriptional regulator with XRE-family HTH domain
VTLTPRIQYDRRRRTTRSQRAEILHSVYRAEQTQEQIAREHGVSQAYVSRVQRDVGELMDIMERLHLSVGELESELTFEDWHRLVTILELEALLRRRGYHRLTPEQLRAQFEMDRTASR